MLCREKLEKEERKNQLDCQNNSRDSAIDNDFQDWDTETMDFEIVSGTLQRGLKSLRFCDLISPPPPPVVKLMFCGTY